MKKHILCFVIHLVGFQTYAADITLADVPASLDFEKMKQFVANLSGKKILLAPPDPGSLNVLSSEQALDPRVERIFVEVANLTFGANSLQILPCDTC